jgi:hypothetical protein
MTRLVPASVFAVLTLSLLTVFARSTGRAAPLRAAQDAPPDAIAADPTRYSVLYENEES